MTQERPAFFVSRLLRHRRALGRPAPPSAPITSGPRRAARGVSGRRGRGPGRAARRRLVDALQRRAARRARRRRAHEQCRHAPRHRAREEAEAIAARGAIPRTIPEVDRQRRARAAGSSNAVIPPPQPGIPVNRSQYQLSASTSFELDFWGKFARASEAARASLLATQFSRDVVDLALAGGTAQAYFALRSLDAQIARARHHDPVAARLARDRQGAARCRPRLGARRVPGAGRALRRAGAAARRRAPARARRAPARAARRAGSTSSSPRRSLRAAGSAAPRPRACLRRCSSAAPTSARPKQHLHRAQRADRRRARGAASPRSRSPAALGAQSAALGDLISRRGGIWAIGARPGRARSSTRAGARRASSRPRRARDQALAGYQSSIETAFREVSDALVNVGESAATEEELGYASRPRATRSTSRTCATSPATRPTSRCSTRSAPPTTPTSPSCATARRGWRSAST